MSPMELMRKMLVLPEQASTMAPRIDTLHFVVLGTAMTGAVVVALVALWFLFRYARKGENEKTPHLTSGRWTTTLKIGGPLTLFLAFWVVGFRQYIALQSPPEGSIEVYVTAKQWMWKFAYPNGPTSISTLVVPVHRPVRLIMSSRDVIHSFYVPSFRVKQDVLPGRYTSIWFEATQTGTFDIFCAEFCGTSHSQMRGQVLVLDERSFAEWREKQAATSSMAARGAELARTKQCLACHTVDGQHHIGPTWRGMYLSDVPLEGGGHVTADESYLTRSMMMPVADVHAGFKPIMPSYAGQLSVEEVAALVEYIKSLKTTGPPQIITLPSVKPTEPSP